MRSIDRNSKEKRYVPHGPFAWTVKNGGIEYLSGGSNYRKPGNLRSNFYAWDWGKKGVTSDGWYRFRIKAGAFAGRGKEAQKDVRLTAEYCYGSPFEVVKSVVIDAPLDAPKEYEFLMYLQAGPPGINRSFNIGWDNGNKDVVKVDPAVSAMCNTSRIASGRNRAGEEREKARGGNCGSEKEAGGSVRGRAGKPQDVRGTLLHLRSEIRHRRSSATFGWVRRNGKGRSWNGRRRGASRSSSRARSARMTLICGRFSRSFCRGLIAGRSRRRNWTGL